MQLYFIFYPKLHRFQGFLPTLYIQSSTQNIHLQSASGQSGQFFTVATKNNNFIAQITLNSLNLFSSAQFTIV